MDDVLSYRAEFVRTCLVPREGAIETLEELRARGIKVGLITVCTEDVELLWPESEFAGLFDAEIFSNAIGLSKPDPRIYLACCEQLGVEPHEARVRRRRRERRARGCAACRAAARSSSTRPARIPSGARCGRGMVCA